MESNSMKVEPVINEIKKEQDWHHHYNEQSHEAMALPIRMDKIEVKPEFNYSMETECKKDFKTKYQCIKCICKADCIDPIGTDYLYENNKIKFEEIDHKNVLLNDNASTISDLHLRPPVCINDDNDDEQKIDISETTLEFGQEYLDSEIKIEKQCEIDVQDELVDPQTGQIVDFTQLKIPLVDHKYSTQISNSNKQITNINKPVNENDDVTTDNDKNSETANCRCDSPTNLNTNSETFCKIHANNKSHVCPSCQKSYIVKRNLFAHILANHSDDQHLLKAISCKIHSCPKCNKQSIHKYTIDDHIRRHHNDDKDLMKTISPQQHCSKCKRRFSRKYLLDQHILSFHGDDENLLKMILCQNSPKCDKQFNCKSNLHNHIISKHNRDQSLLDMTSGPVYDCPKCSRRCTSKSHLDSHIVGSHNTDFTDKELLKIVSSKIYNCVHCSRQFIHKAHLDKHVAGFHNADQSSLEQVFGKIYVCPRCSKQFISKFKFDKHVCMFIDRIMH